MRLYMRYITTLLLILLPSLLQAAPALEGTWSTTSGVGVTEVGHSTYTGTNRILIATAVVENVTSRHADTVYLGNASEALPMTRVAIDSSTTVWGEMWYATEAQIATNQASGVDSIYFAWIGSASSEQIVVGVAVYSGIDQTELAVDSGGTFRGAGGTPNPLTFAMPLSVTSGDLVVGFYGDDNNAASMTWNNSFVEGYDVDNAGTELGSAAHKISSGGTETLSATYLTSGNRAVLVGATFQATVSLGHGINGQVGYERGPDPGDIKQLRC